MYVLPVKIVNFALHLFALLIINIRTGLNKPQLNLTLIKT